MGSSMKVHQLTRGFWDQHEPSLSLGCKRLRPLAPKLTNNSDSSSSVIALDLKSFIKADHTTSGPRKQQQQQLSCNQDIIKQESSAVTHQLEAHSGGTRWNPTQEQIGILEMLYKGGMRTPNAHQIEHITAQLGKYGKIEGKNVFYWFQNHKARERQKQKRNSLGLSHSPRTLAAATTISSSDASGEAEKEEDSQYKRKHRSWAIEYIEESNINRSMYGSDDEEGDKTLELFPLHPEVGRK